jgi:hypothetical protein
MQVFININDYIEVKLNEAGLVHLHETINERLPINVTISLDELRAKADQNGYMKFQLWDFMKKFGDTITFGKPLMFDNMIKIATEY